ncbi:MAG: hypothetical protein HSCHL_0706 [Hydrogenibacillus schlegelii]|uniref:Prepilin type IV endopeptidase peptidase domain-containing protein n=1 Tax=Hydrogenibacillus schlegelii TaxID=1484 RepID=A0A2T5G7R8_HYDSH|nr:A24 family peptidase [Hydrogenibacillus schlegelii]PTQ52235.1 MAG: hypothetical protein HSCHL_0706 [Hydrogenibacillus schlegelii]
MTALVLLPLAAAAWVDFKTRLIPPWTWIAVIALRLVLGPTKEHFLWGLGTFAVFFLWFVLVPGMGGGDVKLLSAMAFFLGGKTPAFLALTFLLALVCGIVLFVRTKNRNALIPLAVPAFVAAIPVVVPA